MKKLLLIFPLLFLSCAKQNIDSIVVKYNLSSEINLFKGSYQVHFLNKVDVNYNFPISENEIIEIKKTYENQNISKYEKELLIVNDEPIIMPATDIKYIVNFSDGERQTFIIRTDFRSNPLEKDKYKNLRIFIEKIEHIINSKNEINQAKKSNALYF